MKLLSRLLLVTALPALLTSAHAETVIFTDTFSSSTLNGTSTPGGTPTASSTSYDIATTKNGTTCTIGPDRLLMKLSSGTTAGYIELQALFTSTPVQLVNIGDRINLTFTFTNSAGTLLAGGNGSVINVGLFNSGGTTPVAGGLNNAGLGTATTFVTGNCQNWQGYVSQINSNGFVSRITTRPFQSAANNANQDLLFSGAGTGLFNAPGGTTISSNLTSTLSLVSGATYTKSFTIKLTGASEVTITDELYSGPVASGVPLSSMVRITSGGTTYTNFSNQYDGLAIGLGNKGTSLNPTMDISKITVTKYTIADDPALYNVQLNGWTNNTVTGAARIGTAGDLWNNPDWTGVYSGDTNLILGAALLTSSGSSLGVGLTMTAKYNNNTTDWNTGVFNHYTGQTAGSATPTLMDQLVKVDYSGSVNVMTMTFTGLPPNKLVTVYAYGAGNGSGQGSTWSLAAANGGGTVNIVYNGSATGRDVTLASSKGLSWETLAGTTDGSGTLTVTATGGTGSVWWQTYMNGLQLQVGGTAPTIIGLVNQTVEDGLNLTLSPVVTGNPPPTYQWYENGVLLAGKTSPTLTLTNISTSQNGYVYSLVAENPIGLASNSMTLTVNASVYSPMTVVSVSPTNGASGICYDTPLTVTFSDPVSLGSVGAIKICDASTGTPVDTISAALGQTQQRTFPGDGQSFTYPTITISGNTVKINPHFNTLTSNKTYYVTIDPKTFKDSGGTNFVGLTATNLWQFTTKATGPADPVNLVVNQDGSADFLTVQGAVNSIANGNTTPTVINIRNGLYNEIVNITAKHNVTFRGQSRSGTVISFPNNATYQVLNSGTTHARMNFKVNANDITLHSLTISNSTPQGGSQAEALMIEGNNAASAAKRCVIFQCDIVSRQDTILANINASQAYFYQSLIKGNFDYIWGGGNLFFEQCEIRTIAGASGFNVTAARTDTGATQSASLPWANPGGTYTANGMSFVNCTFTVEPGVTTVTLAGSNGTAGNNVSWYGCDFATNYITPSATLFSGNYVFWQAANTMTNGAVSFSALTSLTGADARLQAATNVVTWFYGWTPALPPNPPSLSNSTRLPDGNFGFSATGYNGQNYRVWASSDATLTPVTTTWMLIDSGTFGAGPVSFSDLQATNYPQRFYLITVP